MESSRIRVLSGFNMTYDVLSYFILFSTSFFSYFQYGVTPPGVARTVLLWCLYRLQMKHRHFSAPRAQWLQGAQMATEASHGLRHPGIGGMWGMWQKA